jgi:hypothetical protein
MKQEQDVMLEETREISEDQVEHTFSRHVVLNGALWSFVGVALGVLANLVSATTLVSGSLGPAVIRSLSLFLGALLLLGMIIVGIASFMRRKNREVILLKQRVAEIYLSALKKSALNPRLQSSISHD